MIKRKSLIVCLAAALLAGCNSASIDNTTSIPTIMSTIEPVNDYTFLSDKSSLFVKRNGALTSLEVESFEASYYDANEFKSEYLQPALDKYNAAKAGAVSLVSMDAADGKISVKLEFASGADYVEFNKQNNKYFANWTSLQVCAFSGLSAAGYAIPAELIDTSGNSISSASMKDTDKLSVCVVDLGNGYPIGFDGYLQFEGDVLYVAGGPSQTGANSVSLADASGIQYIFFK